MNIIGEIIFIILIFVIIIPLILGLTVATLLNVVGIMYTITIAIVFCIWYAGLILYSWICL